MHSPLLRTRESAHFSDMDTAVRRVGLALIVIGGFALIGVGIGVMGATAPSITAPLTQFIEAVSVVERATPTQVPVSPPLRLTIEKLGIEAAIEQVGLDAKNNMDVPKQVDNVAWYQLGAQPGDAGNAVIAGHLDSYTGPAVFYNLGSLEAGDEVAVTHADGSISRFRVTQKSSYPYDQFPIADVFGPTDNKRLNLITCEGDYSQATKLYSHRIVIYTELIEG